MQAFKIIVGGGFLTAATYGGLVCILKILGACCVFAESLFCNFAWLPSLVPGPNFLEASTRFRLGEYKSVSTKTLAESQTVPTWPKRLTPVGLLWSLQGAERVPEGAVKFGSRGCSEARAAEEDRRAGRSRRGLGAGVQLPRTGKQWL